MPDSDGKWFWLIAFEARLTRADLVGRFPDLRLAVLMDGTVVKPLVSEDRAAAAFGAGGWNRCRDSFDL